MKKCMCGKKHNSYIKGVPVCLNCFSIIIKFFVLANEKAG